MSTDYYQTEASQLPRRSLISLLAIPLLAFIAGVAAMGWLLTRWASAASFLGVTPSSPPPEQPMIVQPVQSAPLPMADPSNAERIVIDPELGRRVVRIEQRIGEIDSQARAAAGNADRAEGLLVAFAARRALDRGVALGYIEGLLRQRFGESQAQAVATIITASRQPVTLQELQEGLQEVGPKLTGGGPNQSWWAALRSEFSGLATIRKRGTPSTVPAERLTRATRRLEAGQVEVALAEVLRMPGREYAAEWVGAARRYVAARRALDAIETAALLDPHSQLRARQAAQQVPIPAAK